MAAIEMLGVRFTKLVVIARAPNAVGGTAVWICRCDCGEERSIAGTALRAGRNKSCGCASPRFKSDRVVKHGMSRTRTYRIFVGMHGRCSDKSVGKERRNYYAKGIRVCERWNDYMAFLADMGECPDGMSIDRIDGKKGYAPENCRWATAKTQGNNTSANHLISFRGVTQTLSMWADEIGIKSNTLLCRIRRGVPLEVAMRAGTVNVRRDAKLARSRECLVCGSEFIPRPSQIRDGVGRCCSRACNGVRIRSLKKDELIVLSETIEKLAKERT